MAYGNVRRSFAGLIWLGGFLGFGLASTQCQAKQPPPKAMFWSWFAEDDFRRVSDHAIGVAYLALSVYFEGQSGVTPSPRRIPVRIPPGMYRMAVIRFENQIDAAHQPAFSPRQRELAIRMVEEIVGIAHPQAVQIDFDAPRSARPFYRQLLSEVRSRIGPDVFLSITALVSWCGTKESWLSGLPVDEIVPMVFSMGQATPATVTMLQRGGQFQFAGCRGSIGIEVPRVYTVPPGHDYDWLVRPRNGQRAYFFPGALKWSPELISRAQKVFLP